MVIDTLIKARWVIPVEPIGVVLEHHALVLQSGRIIDILPSDEAERMYVARHIHDLPHHAVLPGFINAHTHVPMTLFRGMADDLPLMDWLQNKIWPAEAEWVKPDFVADGARLGIAEMLRGGTTCFADMYFYPEIVAQVVRDSGIRACLGTPVLDFPTAWAQNSDEYISKGLALHDEVHNDALLTTLFGPHAPYTVSDEPFRKLLTYANELDIPITCHVHETAFEVEQAVAQSGQRPLARLHALGLLSSGFAAVHMTTLTDEEIALLASTGTHVVHCPESNLKLASGFCPVAKLLAAGVNVALGTDGAASNNDLDMLGEMRTAALLAKTVAQDATAVPAAQALRMATLNGAKALGLGDITGSLEAGKAADIIAINLDHLRTQPLYDPISQIVYAASSDQVSDVWIAGKHVLQNAQLTTLDETQIKQRASEWRARIYTPA
ncbi:MAG: TRZ/ATZ family hydrolase [Gammaproteobacteria bacterium]|nr:TRZ/ATZ family hydrolase [Gammaproteobacteria bacterium]